MATHNLKCYHGSRNGFTLIEILMVVAILGIIGVIVGAQMGGRDDLHATAAARVLSANLQYAQNRAIARRTPHYIVVGADDASLLIRTLEGSTWTDVTHPIQGEALGLTFGPDGTGGGSNVSLINVSFDGQPIFGFDGTGEPFTCASDGSGKTTLGSAATILLRSGEFDQTVRIEPVTGEVSIQ